MLILENLRYAWAYLWSGRTPAIVLGVLFAFLAIGLFIASRTRWGKAKPLTKCVVLSVVAHIWLLLYASGTPVSLPQGDPNGSTSLAVSLDATRLEPAGPTASLEAPLTDEAVSEAALPNELSPWERPLDANQLVMPDVMQDAPNMAEPMTSADLLGGFEPTPLPDLPPLPDAAPQITELPTPDPGPNSNTLPALDSGGTAPTLRTVSSKSLPSPNSDVPAEYQLRVAADRLELARPFGADQDTEAAVAAALKWLAKAQSPDGSWNAKQHGGGTETHALGENRSGTGDRADTGVTGLALLAYLSGGHTHRMGEHQAVVLRGLQYLIGAQMPSGDLSGPKQVGRDPSVLNARMYCHGIAMLALAEAYAMTHDPELRQPLLLAIGYTMQAQDPIGGGWRYRPGDAGDLSQFGWQAMALRSAERSGIRIDPLAQQRMLGFLDSCATGPARGLARYRPREGAASPTMTAEALACRYLLNHRGTAASQLEARNYLLANLPGSSEANVYYWYYATLALFQMQGESWQRWNMAMKTTLVGSQKPIYDREPGSWDPDALWGGYGGRVYSTAMSCLCLEVYYRYLPLYQ